MADTTRLGLNRPDGSDAFSRAVINENWTTLDATPGTFICTSVTRPAYGAAQTGMKILETDTHRELYYTGSGWAPVENYAYTARATINIGATVTNNTSDSAAILTVNPLRACKVLIIMTTLLDALNTPANPIINSPQCSILVDGVVASPTETTSLNPINGLSTPQHLYKNVTILGSANITPGAKTIKLRVKGSTTDPISVVYATAVVIFSEV